MLRHRHAQPLPPQRVVIMGAGGFVGRALKTRLERERVPALALGRSDVDLLAADASERLAALLRPADAFVAVSARAPCKSADMLVENMVMARAMVTALAQNPVSHIVNISSDAVYADGPLPLSESSCASPSSLHGAMHLAREVMFAAGQPAPLAILRPTLIYGARDPHNGYGPNRFRRLAAAGEDIVLFGEGEERRDHVCIDDVAELALRVLLHASAGVLNVATGEVHSFRSIAERIARRAAAPVSIRTTPRSGPMPHDGYRPFDPAGTTAAFPDFRYTPLDAGLAQAEEAP